MILSFLLKTFDISGSPLSNELLIMLTMNKKVAIGKQIRPISEINAVIRLSMPLLAKTKNKRIKVVETSNQKFNQAPSFLPNCP